MVCGSVSVGVITELRGMRMVCVQVREVVRGLWHGQLAQGGVVAHVLERVVVLRLACA